MIDRLVPMTRRTVVRITAAAATAAVTGQAASAQTGRAPERASGQVFESLDGVRRGVPDVLVSNGRDVAVTDSDGRFTLEAPDESVLFVVKPAGYMTPVEAGTMLPRFFYVHQPQGTPATLDPTYTGIAPTGPLPASVNFELRRQDEPKRFEVVLFTDPQPETDAEVDFIREDVVEALAGTAARFGITAGDIMFDDLSMYDRLNRIIGMAGLPWYNIGGNHDLNLDAPDRRYSRETYKRVFGPPSYAFCYGDAVFIMLDDVEYFGADPSRPKGAPTYQGKLTADALLFVENLLVRVPEDKLVVVVLHIQLKNDLDTTPANTLTNRADLFRLFAGRRYTVSFAGHTHTTEHHYFTAADGWPGPVPHHHHVLTAVSGSWWSGPSDHRGVAVADSRDGSPNGFHMLAIDGTSYKTRFVPAKEPGGRQMRLSFDSRVHGDDKEVKRDFRPGQLVQSPVKLAAVPSTTVVANVFDGGPRTHVTLRIGTGEPVPMMRVRRPDPFIEDVFDRNEAVKKPWVKAEPSSHIWTARLPASLGAGLYRLRVEAVTEYGDVASGTAALEVIG